MRGCVWSGTTEVRPWHGVGRSIFQGGTKKHYPEHLVFFSIARKPGRGPVTEVENLIHRILSYPRRSSRTVDR